MGGRGGPFGSVAAVSDVLPTVEAALVEHFGHRPQRASVSFVGVDPIEVLRFEPIPGERAYVSLGMSPAPDDRCRGQPCWPPTGRGPS